MEQARIEVHKRLEEQRAARARARDDSSPLRRLLRYSDTGPGAGTDSASSVGASASHHRRGDSTSAAPLDDEDVRAAVAGLAGGELIEHLTGALFTAVDKEGAALKRRQL